jgi:hypothetical protein
MAVEEVLADRARAAKRADQATARKRDAMLYWEKEG